MRTLLLLVMTLPVWGEVANKISDKWIPANPSGQIIGGYLGERLRVNLEGRLLKVDEQALLEGFQKRPGKHPWIGEHVGKYLDAGATMWELTKDARLKSQMDRMAAALMATQLEDGYLGTYIDAERWTSWDVWVHKYDLIGLLAYHRITGDEKALKSARRAADLLVAIFGEGRRDIVASSTHVGMAATSVLEPICELYRRTGEAKYLEFARYIVRSWEQPNGPKLVSSLLATGNVHKTANGKAYEMMSDLVGLVDLCRLTGEKDYCKVAEAAWADIATNRLYLTGTTSSHEHFQDTQVLPGEMGNDVGEGCATVTWIQLTVSLLRLTADVKYAEELERTVYNQLLAAQDASNGNICYFTPLNGRKRPGPGINCCVSSEPRGIALIPTLAWGTTPQGGVTINLFAPGDFSTDSFRVRAETDYPQTGKMVWTIIAQKPKRADILIRIPAWAHDAKLTLDGKAVSAKPGTYARLAREWKQGAVVELTLGTPLRIIDGGKSYSGFVAFVRGPQVMVAEAARNPQISLIHRAQVQQEGDTFTPGNLVLTPFADATGEYRTWLRKPGTAPETPIAVTLFGRESLSSRDASVHGSIVDDRLDTWRQTNPKPGTEDAWTVEIEQPLAITRVVFVPGPVTAEGGWFQTAESKPIVWWRKPKGQWEKAGALDTYPASPADAATAAKGFEYRFAEPVVVTGVRVTGKPAGKFTTCAELLAFEK